MQEESYSFCCSLYIYLERENLRFSNIVWLTLALTDSCVKCLVTNDMSSSLRKSGSLWITERFISESILTWLSAHCSAVFQFVICTWWSSTFKHFGYPWCEWYKSILDLMGEIKELVGKKIFDSAQNVCIVKKKNKGFFYLIILH